MLTVTNATSRSLDMKAVFVLLVIALALTGCGGGTTSSTYYGPDPVPVPDPIPPQPTPIYQYKMTIFVGDKELIPGPDCKLCACVGDCLVLTQCWSCDGGATWVKVPPVPSAGTIEVCDPPFSNTMIACGGKVTYSYRATHEGELKFKTTWCDLCIPPTTLWTGELCVCVDGKP
jgi:hypothetical protein